MASSLSYPSLDLGFVRYWSPARCMFAGMLFYALVVMTSPLEYNLSYVTWAAGVYAAAVMGAFFGGCYVAKTISGPIENVRPATFQVSPDRFIYLTIIIASIGIVARVYDRFVLRGFTIEENFLDTRETLEGQVSIFGYIGGLAFSFGLIALTMVWLSKNQSRRPITTIIAALLTAYPVAEGLLGANRSLMLHTAILVFILARSTKSLNWLVHSRIALLATGIALLTFFQLLYEIRVLQNSNYEETISEVYSFTAMNRFATIPAWIINELASTDGHGLVAMLLRSWVNFEQHLTHSWVVYCTNFEQFDDSGFGWGYIHFTLPVRGIAFITGQEISYNPFLHGMEQGLYSTAISPIYYDFGGFGVPLAFAFGYGQTVVHRLTIRMPDRWLPLHLLMCLTNFMALMENPLTGGLGAFVAWGTPLYVVIHFIVSQLSRGHSVTPAPEFAVRAGTSST